MTCFRSSISIPVYFECNQDEMIRQITVNCIDQGLLLYRMRNEFRMTLHAYGIIYDSSVHFGLRQALRNEERYSDMQSQVRRVNCATV